MSSRVLWPRDSANLLIDGVLRPGRAGEFPTVNPATEEVLGTAANADAADLDEAIGAARRAFDDTGWSRDTALRTHCLRQLSGALKAHGEELRALTVAEAGVPVALTHGPQLDIPVSDLTWFADLADGYAWHQDLGVAAPMGVRSRRTLLREPAGVVAAITPWNFPHQIAFARLGPALAAGNTVVLKPARHLTKVFLELGGKSAFVVLDDADLTSACAMAAFMVCTHAGQGCALTTRLLVPRARHDEAVEATAAAMSGIRCGDPTDRRTICGPLISARQRDRVEGYLALAANEGGKIVCGGGRPAEHARGFYVQPTLIAGLTNDARVARDEIFGPVLVILPHDGDDDAVRIANDSPYGLSGAVHGTDLDRARAVAARIRTGTLSVNDAVWYSADAPFGGYKQSGIGREMGVAGFEEYLETKLIAEPA